MPGNGRPEIYLLITAKLSDQIAENAREDWWDQGIFYPPQ